MAIDKIKRSLFWLRQTLRITEKTTLPGEILGEIRPTLDSFGWERLSVPVPITATSAGATTLVELPLVPDDEAHYFIAAHITHDDPVGSKDYSLMLVDVRGNRFALTRTIGQSQNFFLELGRPILVPPGGRLAGVSRNAIAGGSNFVIGGLFARLDIGEYLPPVS